MKYFVLLMVSVLIISSFVACADKTKDDEVETKETEEVVEDTKEEPEDETEDEAPVEVKDIELKVWAPQEEQDLLKQMTESFASAHSEYNITWDYGVVAEGDAMTEANKRRGRSS